MSAKPLTLVTGASRGIGRAIALALADAGHDLALLCQSRADELTAVAAEARQRGAEVSAHAANVADEASVEAVFKGLGDRAARLTGLVNNAAYAGERSALADAAISDIDHVLSVNIRGTILMSQRAIPLLAANKPSAIVNLSSQVAQFGGNGLSVYAASKAAINGLTISLARELAGAGIRVNAVSPGPVMTEPLLALTEARRAEMQASLPVGRFCTEEEVAAVVVWLLSPQASYVSGAIVPVHGAR